MGIDYNSAIVVGIKFANIKEITTYLTNKGVDVSDELPETFDYDLEVFWLHTEELIFGNVISRTDMYGINEIIDPEDDIKETTKSLIRFDKDLDDSKIKVYHVLYTS